MGLPGTTPEILPFSVQDKNYSSWLSVNHILHFINGPWKLLSWRSHEARLENLERILGQTRLTAFRKQISQFTFQYN